MTKKDQSLTQDMKSVRRHQVRPLEQNDPNGDQLKAVSLKTVDAQVQDGQISKEDLEWMKAVEEKFREIAGEDKKISYDEFKKAIAVKEEIFVESYFRLFDIDGSGEIEMDEFLQSLRKLSVQTDLDKLRFLFTIFDRNGDGVITPEELKVVLGACVTESSMRMSSERLDQLVTALMQAADKDDDGTITFEELRDQFAKYPFLVENLAISPSNWLKLHKKTHKPSLHTVLRKKTVNLVKNQKPLLFFLLLHFLMTTACFVGSAIKYRSSNGWVIIARGCGMALNYHGAALGMSMARRSLTFVRNKMLGPYLPIDDHITIHKLLGITTLFLGIVHTACHLANIGVVVAGGAVLTYWQYLFTNLSGIGWMAATAYPTGVALTLVLLVIFICSLPIVRKSGRFELFYWSHLLYYAFWLLLLLHGPMFWIWFLVPGLLLISERLYVIIIYFKQNKSRKGFHIEAVNLLPSKVTHLIITRPKSFLFQAGDYVFIRIPSISKWEWHPFSISSAPEQEGVLWLHIRCLGNWTNSLYSFYHSKEYLKTAKYQDEEATYPSIEYKRDTHFPADSKDDKAFSHKQHKDSQLSKSESFSGGNAMADYRRVYIDGPFGSAAVRMGDTHHAVLIAAGIGVTPFASVLQSLLSQHSSARNAQYGNPEETLNDQPRYADSRTLKKIDFVWVNRHANDFDWFITLLTQLEIEGARQNAFDRFLDMHLYMTAAKTSSDLKGVGLQMALELVHQKAQHDLITGLRTRTKPGRPNWRELLKSVKNENHNHVHVFFCGSPTLASIVKDECDNFKFLFSHSF